MSKPQTCGNCRWGKFSPIKSKPLRYGKCDWPMPDLVWPLSLSSVENRFDQLNRTWVHPSYSNCPTWEAKPDE